MTEFSLKKKVRIPRLSQNFEKKVNKINQVKGRTLRFRNCFNQIFGLCLVKQHLSFLFPSGRHHPPEAEAEFRQGDEGVGGTASDGQREPG